MVIRLLLALLVGVAMTVHATDASPPIRVMSFNVRLPVESDGPNHWPMRRDLMIRTLRDARPDLIGTQELFKMQGDAIVEQLPEYAWFGIGRRGDGNDENDEHMGVFYRRDALRLIESGDFWLSDTPDIPGSKSWDNLYPRMVTWGLFERSADGHRFYLLNTHLPYREQDGPARVRSAELILQWLAELPADMPVILVGDFNDQPGSPVYATLAGTLRDAWVEAPSREGPDGTFHGFTGDPEERIDWVFYRGLRPRQVQTLADHEGQRYPSDHFPVLVEFDRESGTSPD